MALAYSSSFPLPLKPLCHGRVMGYVGGGGNIAITTASPPLFFGVLMLNITRSVGSIYLILYWYHEWNRSLRLRFLDEETNPSPPRPVSALFRILCSNVRCMSRNFSDLTLASSQFYILLCCETSVSDMSHVSEFLVPGFIHLVLWRGRMPRTRGMVAFVRDGYGACREPKFGVVSAKSRFLGFAVGDKLFMCLVFTTTQTL